MYSFFAFVTARRGFFFRFFSESRNRCGLVALLFAFCAPSLRAETHTSRPECDSTRVMAAAAADTAGYARFRLGGYGEMLAAFKNYGPNRFTGTAAGSTRTRRNTVEIPRFVLAFGYKFSEKWVLGAEIEFEAGGVGTAVELENSENGEYETEVEKGGEVVVEQFHVTRLIVPQFNVRAGHMVVPVGLTNAHHEPVCYFGTRRPEAETGLLPSTWHDTGLALFGTFGRRRARFDYQAMVVAGLNANGFDRNEWIKGGKAGYFEADNFTSPGYAGRLDYTGLGGLRTGVSVYYCHDAGRNADKEQTYSAAGRVPVAVGTWDAQYAGRFVTARANVVWGYVGNAAAVSRANRLLSNKSPHSRLIPVAKNALSWGIEAGVDLGALLPRCPRLVPFVRCEYCNPQHRGERTQTMERRLEVSQWLAGLDWYALPNLVVKADYAARRIGTSKVFGPGRYNNENEFSISVAYVGWFVRK